MPPRTDVAPRKKKKPVKMVPHGPGGQRLRPVKKQKPKRKTIAVQAPKSMAKFPYSQAKSESRGDTKSDIHPDRPKYKPSKGDTKSAGEFRKAEKYKKSKAYKKDVQRVYSDVPVARRRAILDAPPSPEKTQAQIVHTQRSKRAAKVKKQQAQHDVVYELPKAKKKGGSKLLNAAFIAVPGGKLIKDPLKTVKTGGKIIENAGREAVQIPSSVVPSAVHIGKPVYDNPTDPKAYGKTAKRVGEAAIALPKEYVKAVDKKGLKGAGELFVDKPLSSALTVAPLPRAPGLVAGGVARRAGKMPRVAPRELPGTAMKVQDRTSKSYFKAKRDAKKPKKEVNDKDIDTRVDEHVALMEDLSRREQATTFKKTYRNRKKVVGKKQAVREAAELAQKAQEKIRTEQRHEIAEGMGVVEKPKVTISHPKPVSPKETALKNQIVNLSEAVGQAKKAAEVERKHLKEGQELRQSLLADGKSVAPIQNRLIDSADRLKKRESEVMQLETSLKKVDEQHAKEVLRKGPLAVHQVTPGGNLRLFKKEADAKLAAGIYNRKHDVEMTPFQTKGGYAVVPKSMKDRLEAHEAKSEVGPLGAAVKGYNTVWRKNVLALHPSWYTGNIIEAAARSLIAGVGPTAYVRGFKYRKAHTFADPKGAKTAEGHTTRGGHLAMQARLPEETKSDITGHGFLADTARKAQAVRDNPKGPKQVADLFNTFTDFTMGTLSGKAESFFQTGMLGKELARSPLMDGHVNKTSKAAIDDAVKGMKETHNQVALGQAVDRMYGKYGKFSPGRRKMISHYTPFIAWTLNSLEFLGKVLPVDHPVLTAAVASSQPYVEEWLKDKGLNPFVKGHLPSFLQGSIPTKKGEHSRAPTRYLPVSVASGFPESVVGSLLPQVEPAYNMAVNGINWKGDKINNPDGTPLDPLQLSIAAALTLLEGGIPGAQQIAGPSDRYAVQGKRGLDIAKPKSGGEIAKSFLNPFPLVKAKDSKEKKSGSLLDEPKKVKRKSLLDAPKKEQKSLLDSP